MAAVATGESEICEEPWNALIKYGTIIATSLVPESRS
jgi:hypothetical protein